ncbi:MAG: trypsin-like peptidase domain-containing protein [Saprospiraceae bacterium]|nr:trypsin-like peptidase domain-containing protein [Saprospiraceae bacterium]
MKNFISNLLPGIAGGALVLGSFLWYHSNTTHSISDRSYTHQVNEAIPVTVGPDFSIAAEKALNVVVQINAQESEKLARQKMEENNPFGNHPFFREFELRGFGFLNPYQQQKKGSGSGVIYSNDGYIVTNNHVVEFADDVEVILKDGRKFKAKKIGTDPRTDLAVLKIEASNLPVLPLANSDAIKVGEWVLAVGNPFGYLTSTVTAGIISAKGRDLNLLDNQEDSEYYNPYGTQNNHPIQGIEEYLQTDAAVNPGNSGGALVDVMGRLVGINSAIASKTGYYAGYSFAIPSNLMRKIIQELIDHGSFDRGRFGVGVVNVDEELKKEMNLNINNGVLITELEDKGSAKFAGLLPNDIIIEINNKSIKTVEDLQKVVALTKIGETLYTKIIRDGQPKEIPVKIKKMI